MRLNTAYEIIVRRVATGCDYHLRLFAKDSETACDRAINKARLCERMTLEKFNDLRRRQGLAVFRIVSCEIAANQEPAC